MAEQFVILPRSGVRAATMSERSAILNLPRAVSTQASRGGMLQMAPGHAVTVVDTIHEDVGRLVEMSPQAAEAANAQGSPIRALPVVTYEIPKPAREEISSNSSLAAGGPAAAGNTFTILCRDSLSHAPLSNCEVVAFDNFAARTGDSGTTDATGRVVLTIAGNTIDRLYVYSESTHWGAFRKNVPFTAGALLQVDIEAVSLSYVDAVRQYYGSSRFNPATGVQVGVIDTGVGPHNNINVVSGRNTVTGQPAGQYQDVSLHGTHVAGLIGSNGSAPTGLRGVAPNVSIRAYRVFGAATGGATNYAVLKAMIFAADDGCDIINLSLGGGPFDDIVNEAIADARSQGMLVVIAAGNDGRKAVSYPAAYLGATAISALGCDGTFPSGSLSDGDVLRPPTSSSQPKEFVAAFSNVGPQIAVTGAGVGVLSTLPNHRHGPMSGTSMAAPVVAGAAASLLSQNPAIYGMARNAARSAAIERLLQSSCTSRGFPVNFEGYGMPDPSKV